MINVSWLGHEMKLQMKNGLYAIYIVVNLIYLFLMGYVPDDYKEIVLSIIIFSDPTALGMIFIGAFMLLEKIGGVTGGIAVSPLGAGQYIGGKVVSMLFISLVTSLVLTTGVKGTNYHFIGLALIITISSILFTLLGILTAIYTRTLNEYLMVIIGAGFIIALPLIDYFHLMKLPFLRIIPTYYVFQIIERTVKGQGVLGIPMFILLLWLAVIYLITREQVDKKLFRG